MKFLALRKSGVEAAAVRMLRECQAPPNGAQPLDRGAFSATFTGKMRVPKKGDTRQTAAHKKLASGRAKSMLSG